MLTNEGQCFVGVLEGYDNMANLILTKTQERVIGPEESMVEHVGALIIRGDSVTCVGLIDEEIDSGIDWTKVHAEPI